VSIQDLSIVTANAGPYATAIALERVQEINLERLYLIGNNGTGQTGIQINGKGNYAGGTFNSLHVTGFDAPISMNGDATGAANASTFVRTHINCATAAGSRITGTIGIALNYGDGNTFVGGDIEDCDTMIKLGAGATNNTFTGVRNENSNKQITALAGSSYNLWIGGGTLFTGNVTDAGTHNSFADTFHRAWNQLNGDVWRSQADTTVTNHFYTGIGAGNVRGQQDSWTTDVPGSPGQYQQAWIWGPGDGTSGTQVWQLYDSINSVNRIAVNQRTTAGGQNDTAINSAGTGGICLNCSANSGTNGLTLGTGGPTVTNLFRVDKYANIGAYGTLHFNSGTTDTWDLNCANTGSCGLHNANATNPGDVFKAYTNGATNVNSQGSAAVAVNNTSTGGTGGLIVYEGGTNYNNAAFTVTGTGTFSSANSGQIGNASGTGNLTVGNHLNQIAANDFAGECSTNNATSCTVSFQHSWNNRPACSVTAEADPGSYYWYTWGTNVVTVHSASNSTATWAVSCTGNPN
jgi:hypothetical protein